MKRQSDQYMYVVTITHACMYVNVMLQINDNGVISFKNSFNVRTPLSLPLSGTQQIIAPYWADVDTRRVGQIYYRQSTNPSLLARASKDIQRDLSLTHNIEIQHLLIATWNAVGYYNRKTDKVCCNENSL